MSKSKFIFFSLVLFVSEFVSAQTVVLCRDAQSGEPVIFEVDLGQGMVVSNDSGKAVLALTEPVQAEISSLGFYSEYLTLKPDTSYVLYLTSVAIGLRKIVVSDVHGNSTTSETVLNITRIDKQQIDQLGAVDLKDILSFENNIRISRDNALGSAGMSLMGIGGNNVKIMINGVPIIGRMLDQLDLEQFNLENIEQVEIVKGPMSVIYGSNALAGTINIVSSSFDQRSLSGRFYYESDGQFNTTFNASVPLNKSNSINLSGGRQLFRGWSLHDTDRTFDWIPKDLYNFRFGYNLKLKSTNILFRSEIMHSYLLDRGRALAPYFEFGVDQHYRNIRFDNSINLTHDFKRSKLRFVAGYNEFKRLKNKYYKNLVTLEQNLIPVQTEQDSQYFHAYVMRGMYDFVYMGFKTIVGLDINYENGEGQRIENRKQDQLDQAIFISSEKILSNAILVRGGIRVARNSAFESPLLYSLQTRIRLGKSSTLKLAYGKGFRAPSIKELYLDFNDSRHNVYGNSELRPETAHSFTFTYNNYFAKGDFVLLSKMEGFYNNIRDKIELVVLGPIEATYNNIGRYETVGGGLSERVLYKDWSLTGSVNYTGIYTGLGEGEGKFYFSPQFVLQPGYHLKKADLDVNMYVNHMGAFTRIFADTSSGVLSQERLNAYTMVDLTIRKSFFKRMYITAGFRNLFGIQNVGASIANVTAHTPSSSYISVSPGRTYFISIRYAFIQ